MALLKFVPLGDVSVCIIVWSTIVLCCSSDYFKWLYISFSQLHHMWGTTALGMGRMELSLLQPKQCCAFHWCQTSVDSTPMLQLLLTAFDKRWCLFSIPSCPLSELLGCGKETGRWHGWDNWLKLTENVFHTAYHHAQQ